MFDQLPHRCNQKHQRRMELEAEAFLKRTCRICSLPVQDTPNALADLGAEDHEETDAHGILLFGEEGRKLQLRSKIRKYLYITIALEDRLPKIMCQMCFKKLESIHNFAAMALKSQEKLNNLLETEVANNIQSRGLLHTYLTKGVIDTPKDESSTTEEMEVRLDPMLILQYSSALPVCAESPDKDQNQDGSSNSLIQLGPTGLYSAMTQSKLTFRCGQCSITFPTELALQSHNWQHIAQSLTNNNLKNDGQSESTSSQSDQDTDEEDNSEEDKTNRPLDLIARPYQLPFFPTASSIQSMLLSALNRGIERFCCPICGKRISTKGNLKVHLDTHRPKGKYGCDICGRIFKTQCNLLRHKEYHQGVQFTCMVCGRVYPTNSTLRAHSITHSDLRPHKCPLCDKTFKRNQDLKFHINQHTGARPYQCPYCPKAFASSGNCFSHRKRMHPEEVERDKERAAKIIS